MPNEYNIKNINDERHAVTERHLKQAAEMALNSDEGICVKDIAREFNISSNSARRYMLTLLDRNLVYPAGKVGKTVLYKAVEPKSEKQPANLDVQEVETSKEDLMPVGHSGKEFAPGSYIPCTDQCKPGDVVWISSRSGEGAFFRYLIITPWEYKAMVLGIFEEGHPKLDLNDPYYCYIGQDPESGVKLYADLRNNCQRGYKQFGERLMHVDQDLFDDVKARLARSMGIDRMKINEADPDIVKLLKSQLEKAKAAVSLVSKERDDIRTDLGKCKTINNELTGENAILKKNIEGCRVQIENQKQTIHTTLESLHKESEEKKALQECNNNQAETITDLKTTVTNLTTELQRQLESHEEAVAIKPKYDDDIVLGMVIDSKVKETKIDMLEEQVKMLRQMVFNMIKGGGAA